MKEKIPNHQIWNIKNSLSEFLVPRLLLYIEKIENNENMSIPDWVEAETSNEDYQKKWIVILKDMLIPFDYELHPEKYFHLSNEELDFKKKKGLELFAKYFKNLWD